MYQEKIRTLHLYVTEDEEETAPVIDAEPERELPPPVNPWGIVYCSLIGACCTLVPLLALLLASLLPSSDLTISQTLTLTLAVHPSTAQESLFALTPIALHEQSSAPATGLVQEPATKAVGLLTFYNGSFTTQFVAAGTRFTGRDGSRVVTTQAATIPPATATTPPTDGTASVMAVSLVAGATGNILPSDIHAVCCGGVVLVQNLDAFSGGQDAHTATVVTQRDITTATAPLQRRLEQEANNQAQRAFSPGTFLLPLACTTRPTANHQPGDQATQVQVTVSVHCQPFAYALAAIQQRATASIRQQIPATWMLDHLTAIVLTATVTDAARGTATVTIHVTAWVKAIHPSRSRER
jgi:hypothetical protein